MFCNSFDINIEFHWYFIFYILIAGIVFGLTARLFSIGVNYVSKNITVIKYPPLRPFVGGIILVGLFMLIDVLPTETSLIGRYEGLGIPVIFDAFQTESLPYDFIIKLILTVITLGVGFKGGEVTPLFFIGATLGSALSLIIPLPIALLAGMGFVSVFAGAANTPIACIVMSIELFGIEGGIYIALSCLFSYLFSGHTGIYSSQKIGEIKNYSDLNKKGKKLRDFK